MDSREELELVPAMGGQFELGGKMGMEGGGEGGLEVMCD